VTGEPCKSKSGPKDDYRSIGDRKSGVRRLTKKKRGRGGGRPRKGHQPKIKKERAFLNQDGYPYLDWKKNTRAQKGTLIVSEREKPTQEQKKKTKMRGFHSLLGSGKKPGHNQGATHQNQK